MDRRLFVTGATGYVGRHVVREFLARGYRVAGLVRSDQAARKLAAAGAEPVHGELARPDTYREAAASAHILIHAGFEYGADGTERSDVDQAATRAMLEIAGGQGGRSFVYTSSVFRYRPLVGPLATEKDSAPAKADDWRHALSEEVLACASADFKTSVIRLGWVYGSDGGTLAQAAPPLAAHPVPEGIRANRIPLVHVEDLAKLYAEAGTGGRSGIVHACQGEPISVARLAALAAAAGMAEGPTSRAHADHFAGIFGMDTPAASIYVPADPRRDERLGEYLGRPVKAAA